jgi:hypothetical protein
MDSVDLQQYFPQQTQVIEYRKASGNSYAKYTFQPAPTPVDSLYYGYMNLNQAGHTYMWRKQYWKAEAWCTETYAVLVFGDDGSIKETGDWMPSSVPCQPNTMLGYKNSGVNYGLVWSPGGGLSKLATIAEMDVFRQNTPGASVTDSGHDAYSKVGLVEHLESYTPPYGRCTDGTWGAGCGKTYYDVAHIVMYHGTRKAVPAPVRCVGAVAAQGVYYQSYLNYNSYAIELYLARDKGIIQENTPYIEDAGFWPGLQNCTGDLFQYQGQWPSYIDE